MRTMRRRTQLAQGRPVPMVFSSRDAEMERTHIGRRTTRSRSFSLSHLGHWLFRFAHPVGPGREQRPARVRHGEAAIRRRLQSRVQLGKKARRKERRARFALHRIARQIKRRCARARLLGGRRRQLCADLHPHQRRHSRPGSRPDAARYANGRGDAQRRAPPRLYACRPLVSNGKAAGRVRASVGSV